MDVTVVIGVYGDKSWQRLAVERALPSVQDVPVVLSLDDDLASARNHGLEQVDTEWVCFLDADDELEPGYFDAMAAGTTDLRAPSVRYVRNGRPQRPWMPQVAGHRHTCHADCLAYGNWLVIGTLVRAAMVRDVGGFRGFDWSEDWDLWVRCWQAGATIAPVPQAVYRAHVRPDSRNRAPDRAVKLAQHQAIAEANGLPT